MCGIAQLNPHCYVDNHGAGWDKSLTDALQVVLDEFKESDEQFVINLFSDLF